MKIASVERFGRDDLLAKLRQTRLRGLKRARVYYGATLEVEHAVDPDRLAPAQRYVLRAGVEKILELRAALLEHDLDVFALGGGAAVRTAEAPDQHVPVIPPIVEESVEPNGRKVLLISDGIHRVFAARSLGLPISAIVVRGAAYPYYALALERGWDDVAELAELPDGFQKKEYRIPHNYKALFREYNEMFPGVQRQRKQSNPGHLRA